MAASTWWHRELWADWAGVAFVAVLLVVVQVRQLFDIFGLDIFSHAFPGSMPPHMPCDTL